MSFLRPRRPAMGKEQELLQAVRSQNLAVVYKLVQKNGKSSKLRPGQRIPIVNQYGAFTLVQYCSNNSPLPSIMHRCRLALYGRWKWHLVSANQIVSIFPTDLLTFYMYVDEFGNEF